MDRLITVYTTSHRRKARMEMKRAGIKPYTPREFGGMIAANDRPISAVYVHGRIGQVRRNEFARLYARTSRTQRRHRFNTGDRVSIQRGHATTLHGTIAAVIGGGWYEVTVQLLGKACRVKLKETDMQRSEAP